MMTVERKKEKDFLRRECSKPSTAGNGVSYCSEHEVWGEAVLTVDGKRNLELMKSGNKLWGVRTTHVLVSVEIQRRMAATSSDGCLVPANLTDPFAAMCSGPPSTSIQSLPPVASAAQLKRVTSCQIFSLPCFSLIFCPHLPPPFYLLTPLFASQITLFA